MKPITLFTHLAGFLALTLSSATVDAGNSIDSYTDSFRWTKGPARICLEEFGTLEMPAGGVFLEGPQAKALLGKLGNKTSGDEVGFIASEFHDWSVVIEFHKVGYVSDSRWESLDAASILEAIRTTDQRANAEREQNGWPTIRVRDWESAPTYDASTRSVEWAIRAESEGTTVVNRIVTVLGRRGVVQFILVDPHRSPLAVADFKELVRGFAFQPGERYADSRPGDRAAVGGLAAIVSGLNAPETAEPTQDRTASAGRAASLAGEHSWLIGIVAAVVGFAAGRKRNRHLRVQRYSSHAASTGRRGPDGASPPLPSGQESMGSIRGAGATVAGAAGSSRPVPFKRSSDTAGKRHRRCNAYSFYEKLTRDLHWTINY